MQYLPRAAECVERAIFATLRSDVDRGQTSIPKSYSQGSKHIVLQVVARKVSEPTGPPTEKPRDRLSLPPTDAREVERLIAASTTSLGHGAAMFVGPIRVGLHAEVKRPCAT